MSANNYQEIIQSLKNQGTILYPTETVWGLGCDARFDSAIDKIFKIKNRVEDKGLILLISKIEQLSEYVVEVPDIAWDIVEFAEKPLTVIYPQGKNVSSKVLGPNGSIAIRLVKDSFCKELIFKYQRAIVSTSANISGEKIPQSFEEISPSIIQEVDSILKPGEKHKFSQKPSKIISLGLGGDYKMIRE
jgi:L-threonylcarbamoyladenylate synthase